MLDFIFNAFLFIFPAYVANACALVLGFGSPIDKGKIYKDGKPLLGKGKTWRGLYTGIFCGVLTGIVLYNIFPITDNAFFLSLLLSIGALSGDVFFSFLKRRIGIKRGQAFPFFDQVDFLIGAVIFAAPILLPSWETLVFLFIVTPILHLATNFTAFVLGMKDKPY